MINYLGPKPLREQLWKNGYRPVIISHGVKFPTYDGWNERALRDPPACITEGPNPLFPHTGLLASGLRAIDADLADPEAVIAIADYCLTHLGDAPIRVRENSSRMLMVYRAAEGTPPKVKAWNSDTKEGVEVLGHGQQFLAYGRHPSGAKIEWLNDQGPHSIPIADLTAVSDDQIMALLSFCKPFVGEAAVITQPHEPRPLQAPSETPEDDDLAALLDAIPNVMTDYDKWFRVGAAIHTVTGGSATGYDLFVQWSRKNPAHGDRGCHAIWRGLDSSNPGAVKLGTLIHYAREADPAFRMPDAWDKPGMTQLERVRSRVEFEKKNKIRRLNRFIS